MITEKEIIYIASFAILFLYSVGLTASIVIMSRRAKQSAKEMDERILKADDSIKETERRLDTSIETMDKSIKDAQADAERKIKDMGEELYAGVSQLVEQKTADVIGRITQIDTRINIMDSTVRNLEREKFFVQGMLLGETDAETIEADYTELPEGIAAGAKRAIAKAASKGKAIVKDYYPFIKNSAPGIARAAIRFVKSRSRNNGSKE